MLTKLLALCSFTNVVQASKCFPYDNDNKYWYESELLGFRYSDAEDKSIL